MSRGLGVTQQKILVLLAGGLVLGLTRSPKQYFSIVRGMRKEWQRINRQSLTAAIRALYASKLVEEIPHVDGSITLVLSGTGKKKVMQYKMDEMKIKKQKTWDEKWHFVTFDVPEHQKKVRDALRFHFRQLGLREFQKSMFLTPYPCTDEVEFIIEYFQARQYVRIITADSFDNELHWMVKFNLPTDHSHIA